MFKKVIIIPGVPTAKGRGRVGMGGHGRPVVYTPQKTRDFENLVKLEARRVMGDMPPFDGTVELVVRARLPIPDSFSKKKREMAMSGELLPGKRPDLDNYIKSASDGIDKIVVSDDSRVVKLSAIKVYAETPGLDIKIVQYPLPN